MSKEVKRLYTLWSSLISKLKIGEFAKANDFGQAERIAQAMRRRGHRPRMEQQDDLSYRVWREK